MECGSSISHAWYGHLIGSASGPFWLNTRTDIEKPPLHRPLPRGSCLSVGRAKSGSRKHLRVMTTLDITAKGLFTRRGSINTGETIRATPTLIERRYKHSQRLSASAQPEGRRTPKLRRSSGPRHALLSHRSRRCECATQESGPGVQRPV